ncbi:MAG: T9SS type A sorting domain-containing protein [Bacteroidetes bacterium]|nr:T9SS type A sorting domain-containing protein [Bacteroidota bacterium]
MSDTTIITVNPYPAMPVITTSDTVVFCMGENVILYSSSSVGNMWTGGSTGDSLIVSDSGAYSVTVTIGGCSTVSTDTTVTVNPLPTVTLASFTTTPCSDDAPFALVGGLPAGGTYSGIGVTSGTTFNPGSAGAIQGVTYTYIDLNGCANVATSNMTVVFCTGIEEYTSENVSVYPNPTTTGIFNITLRNASSTEMMISIIDIQGKEVYKALEKNISADYKKEINIMHLAKGIYYIKLSTDVEVKIQKLIVE